MTDRPTGTRLTDERGTEPPRTKGTDSMSIFRRRSLTRRAVAAICACLILATVTPFASAQDEPAFVYPCADGVEWGAAPGQPIQFACGWGVQGGPGLIRIFLGAHAATLVLENDQGDPVLTIDPAGFATLWGDPESFPSGFEDVTCAGPTGRGVVWSYLLEGGLPEGTYTVTLDESLRHPVTDGFQTCRFDDGTQVVEPPNQIFFNGATAVGTIIVGD
jgi:hypothetical protein